IRIGAVCMGESDRSHSERELKKRKSGCQAKDKKQVPLDGLCPDHQERQQKKDGQQALKGNIKMP
ncbi:MAG: hypothetical protein QF886_02015, partial [Planctomycetota bacterium]|nr:hypothetical protein [Planctomycetota bacterium]